ncbi:hypothetical protein D9611_007089 [Ephemerocybe angulata]|uniref:Uncharacterized protein n=2 Tax=Ephemerocybe angulata TaxID=980116 RepID=A0A8H5EW94_9AGAR|nr:hypothetical protein D9611_007089 [Tulosesus angulatus]KAF6745361.1 carbohydrate-binding module family 13 protein [Tulosesus angulatus]
MIFNTWSLLLAAVTLVSAQTPSGSLIHFNGSPDKCLSVFPQPRPSNGQEVQLQGCSQLWKINRGPTKLITADHNMCLDAGSSPTNGTKLKLWDCYDNLPAQSWYFTDDNRIALKDQGFCIDLPDGKQTDGQVLQIWACSTGNTNQVWTL